MTIDEAIAHAKEKAEKNKEAEAMFLRDDLIWNAKQEHKLAEEHEQLAEWLEELKKLKAENAYLHCEMQAIGATMDMFETEIRNKAIDDFAEALKKYYQCYDIDLCLQDNDHLNYTDSRIALESYIDEIAEQLKGE